MKCMGGKENNSKYIIKREKPLLTCVLGDLYLAFTDWFFQSKTEDLSQIGQALTYKLKYFFVLFLQQPASF